MQSVFKNSLETLIFKSQEMSKIDHIFIANGSIHLNFIRGSELINPDYILLSFVSCDKTKTLKKTNFRHFHNSIANCLRSNQILDVMVDSSLSAQDSIITCQNFAILISGRLFPLIFLWKYISLYA
mgnify:CR=1 FL=1